MPAKPGPYFEAVSRQGLDLAERRVSYYAGLYQSGRWQRYYTPQNFAARIADAMKAVATWRSLAGLPPASDGNNLRPAA
jgi:uncharacterized repeat protein (TIGR03809 family)